MAGGGGGGGGRTPTPFRTLALQASAPPLGDASIRYILPAKAKISALGETRTHNRFLRREVLYPVKLRAQVVDLSIMAEGTGVEPVRACAHWFSKPTHYRPAHPPNEVSPELLVRDNKVYPVRFERTTFSSAGRRSNPTELRVHWAIFYHLRLFFSFIVFEQVSISIQGDLFREPLYRIVRPGRLRFLHRYPIVRERLLDSFFVRLTDEQDQLAGKSRQENP